MCVGVGWVRVYGVGQGPCCDNLCPLKQLCHSLPFKGVRSSYPGLKSWRLSPFSLSCGSCTSCEGGILKWQPLTCSVTRSSAWSPLSFRKCVRGGWGGAPGGAGPAEDLHLAYVTGLRKLVYIWTGREWGGLLMTACQN